MTTRPPAHTDPLNGAIFHCREIQNGRCIIDYVAEVLRKPSAAPIMTPGEVIALALNGTSWIPGHPVEDGDMVIFQTLRLLRQAGYAIVPATKEDKR